MAYKCCIRMKRFGLPKKQWMLFGVDRTVVTRHLKNIFDSPELQQHSVCANFAHTAGKGNIYNTAFYNLDAIISVGYRVNSVCVTLSALTYKESIRSANKTAVSASSLGASLDFHATTNRTDADFTL